jgi:CubicO group peptidase (beta-lactamase class C family)
MKIFGPLGMSDTGFLPPRSPQARFVATEVGNNWERDACQSYDRRVEVAWRDYPISGEVHDGNSFYGFRGTGGNAGLFSTAADLAIFLRSLLNHKSVVGPATIERMVENHTAHLDQGRGLGWGVGSRFAGTKLSRKTFGHTGFTGCCTYADPVTRTFIVLLTNSVHPRVRKGILDEIRPQVCDLAYEGVAELLE